MTKTNLLFLLNDVNNVNSGKPVALLCDNLDIVLFNGTSGRTAFIDEEKALVHSFMLSNSTTENKVEYIASEFDTVQYVRSNHNLDELQVIFTKLGDSIIPLDKQAELIEQFKSLGIR